MNGLVGVPFPEREMSDEELKAAAASSQAEYARAARARDSFSVEEFEHRR